MPAVQIGREHSGSHQQAFQRMSQPAKGEVRGPAGNLPGWSVLVHSVACPFILPFLYPFSKKKKNPWVVLLDTYKAGAVTVSDGGAGHSQGLEGTGEGPR